MHGRSSKSVRQKILVPSYQTVSRSMPSSEHQTGNALFHRAVAATGHPDDPGIYNREVCHNPGDLALFPRQTPIWVMYP
ncbi:MAG: hypothetical protein WBB95_26515, partial [Pseudomonas sp.]|uniref:hypothetical protein n=1 Tax=Pseudomonas sp. TaxID=306 RepID=UPI003C738F1E